MNKPDAYLFYDHLLNRIMGWDIVMAMSPETGRIDFRTRRSKEAMELMRDIILNNPKVDTVLACLEVDGDVTELWPEELREVVRFRIGHKVPREHNEPTNQHAVADRKEHGGAEYPDWLLAHGEPATVADHPPFPKRSALYLEVVQ